MRFRLFGLALFVILLAENGLGVPLGPLWIEATQSKKKTVLSAKSRFRKSAAVKKSVIKTPVGDMADLAPARPRLESVMPAEKNGQLVLAASPAFTDFDLPTDNQMIFAKQN